MANVFYLFHVKEVSNKKKTQIVLSRKTIVWFQSTGRAVIYPLKSAS